MPHTFPEIRLRPDHTPQPDIVNKAVLPVVEKLAGRVGENDIDADTRFPLTRVRVGAYTAVDYLNIASNPFWRSGAQWAVPDGDTSAGGTPGGFSDAVNVEDSVAWQALPDMTRTVSTGEDALAIFVRLQYVAWRGDIAATPTTPPTDPLRLQFAIRLDGEVLEDSPTGTLDPFDKPPQELYKAHPFDASGSPWINEDPWDFRHVSYISNASGLANQARSVRLSKTVPVMEGSHTIEVVARRHPTNDCKRDNAQSDDPDATRDGSSVQVFNRQYACIRLKGVSKSVVSAPSLPVHALDDLAALSQANLATSRLDAIRTYLNDLPSGAFGAGAFRNDHLPAAIKMAQMRTLSSGSATVITSAASTYPGFNSTAAGWTTVQDAVGTLLRIDNSGAGYNFNTTPGYLVVMANVRVNRIWENTAAYNGAKLLAMFALRTVNSVGGVDIIEASEAYLNSYMRNPRSGVTDLVPIYESVPLMWVIDTSTLSAANKTTNYIEVVSSVWDGSLGGLTVRCDTQQASLFGFLITR